MTVKECYECFDGDYNEVFGRLLTDDRIKKFLLMFLKDKSFEMLCNSMENGDYETAFRNAHTLKGTCLNLGIERLKNSSSEITEALRGLCDNGASEILPQVKSDYLCVINAINQLD